MLVIVQYDNCVDNNVAIIVQFNESTGTTWNATAELFINTGDNSRLDPMLFVRRLC
jgi:hypothetical protein